MNPYSYTLTTLGDLINFRNGRSCPDRVDNGKYPVFGANGEIGRVNESNAPANTIIIGRVGSYCGSVHLSKSECWVTDNAIKAIVKLDNVARFIFYILKHLGLNNWRSGSGQPLLNQSTLNSISVRIPSPLIQQKISDFIEAIDDRIAILQETNTTLELIAQALFKSWFIDFDPIHAKAEGREPEGMDTETAALFPKGFEESALGLVPKAWNVTSFLDTIHVIGGGTPKTSVPEYWDGEIPWFSVVDAPIKTDVFVMDTEKHITELAIKNSSTKLLSEGTTIISARGTVGRVALVGKVMAMNQSCYGLVGKAKDSFFTYL